VNIHGHLALGIAAAAWLAWAYWSVSYVRIANVLARWINEHDPEFWTRNLFGWSSNRAQDPYYYRRRATRLEWTVLFASSRYLPKDESFLDQLGDARWAAGFSLFFWTIAIAATGMLSFPH
jgi:hypothetical protein